MQTFLQAFSVHPVIGEASLAANIDRRAIDRWMKKYPEFKLQVDILRGEFLDTLEYSAYELATVGERVYVSHNGKLVYGDDGKPLVEYHRSPFLLALLLRAWAPERYNTVKRVALEANEPTVRVNGWAYCGEHNPNGMSGRVY